MEKSQTTLPLLLAGANVGGKNSGKKKNVDQSTALKDAESMMRSTNVRHPSTWWEPPASLLKSKAKAASADPVYPKMFLFRVIVWFFGCLPYKAYNKLYSCGSGWFFFRGYWKIMPCKNPPAKGGPPMQCVTFQQDSTNKVTLANGEASVGGLAWRIQTLYESNLLGFGW